MSSIQPSSPVEDRVWLFKFATESSVYTEVRQVLAGLPNWKETKGTRFHLLLAERWQVPYPQLGIQPGLLQCVNHIRGTKDITIKALMVKTLRNYQALEAAEAADIITPTYLLVPGGGQGCERKALLEAIGSAEKQQDRPPIWICKATTGAHGSGILVTQSAERILEYIDSYLPDNIATENPETMCEAAASGPGFGTAAAAKRKRPAAWLVQRYIERPLLYHGRKFDIRALVCVLSTGQVFWYPQWIVRTCSQPYSLDDLDNKIAHISNHCVQATAAEYSAHEDGNELFSDDFERYLTEQLGGREGPAVMSSIVAQMQEAVVQTLRSISEVFDLGAPYRSFQLLGYDFMVDESHRVWLLECNGSPACASRMLPQFAADTVTTAINGFFCPDRPAADRYPGGCSGSRFELIASLGP